MDGLSPDELHDWLRLEQTPGVGRETARKLLAACGLPANIFASSRAQLARIVPEKIASALLAPPSDATLVLLERTAQWLEHSHNQLLTLADPRYPRALLDIPDPPLLLYARGRLELLEQQGIAIVGSRNASTQGMLDAERFAESLSQAGLCVVSGLAGGIDTAAHRGGLRGPGSSVAVVGTGLDIVYPAKNHALAQQLAQEGCLLSEYALGTPAITHNFPRRNRIISGLSRGVLVIEAALQSGSLITARSAAEQGREVFALPGSIHAPLAKGCHQLIKQGAKLVESAQDVLEELRFTGISRKAPQHHAAAPEQEDALLHNLGHSPVSLDELSERSKLAADELAEQLLALELDGKVERLLDGRYQRLQA
ncbi:DNA-processing protein DprA [Massilia sp. W12]|uniref:DNA-processing protein DprA n=1 Tax=Massilia sp. W12 TaxID=3126507 RepID=UPI0030D11FED